MASPALEPDFPGGFRHLSHGRGANLQLARHYSRKRLHDSNSSGGSLSRWPPLILLAVTLTALLVIFATSDAFPDRVASSFGSGGAAQAWMTRDFYTLWTAAFAVGLPWIVFAAIAIAPRLWPRHVNLPNRDFWLAPTQREASLAFLAAHGAALGCLMSLFAVGIHALLAYANALSPPQLPTGAFLTLLGGFLAAIGLWMVAMLRRFPKPPVR